MGGKKLYGEAETLNDVKMSVFNHYIVCNGWRDYRSERRTSIDIKGEVVTFSSGLSISPNVAISSFCINSSSAVSSCSVLLNHLLKYSDSQIHY